MATTAEISATKRSSYTVPLDHRVQLAYVLAIFLADVNW